MLKVNEIFGPTIQGEGPSSGKEVCFIRLALCNLYCVWCDTPYTWNWKGSDFEHPEKFDKAMEVHSMTNEAIVDAVVKLGAKAIVISGGEPLAQIKDLVSLCVLLKKEGMWIEIETNGTIAPTMALDEVVDQYNCSPKLRNSKVLDSDRLKTKALIAFVDNPKTCFKFVVASEKDVEEAMSTFDCTEPDRIYLMPLGKTKEELIETTPVVKALAEKYGFHASPRLHVELFGGKRGV